MREKDEGPALNPTHGPRVLGIDPGLRTTGYSVLEKVGRGTKLCEAGVLTAAAKGDLAERVRQLFDGLVQVLEEWSPTAMAMEQLYAHYAHPRTAILMGHARGAFLLAAAQRNVPVISYASTKVKRLVTGSGRAGKPQVQHAVARELGLTTLPEPHDVADALAVALCHLYTLKT
ncbi:MAG TPA: crossover junction endodeoxyribonuclease RuvC [Fimbriiglobus sp.]|jgi:crossover junction endodeoxyribonuclease RuvC